MWKRQPPALNTDFPCTLNICSLYQTNIISSHFLDVAEPAHLQVNLAVFCSTVTARLSWRIACVSLRHILCSIKDKINKSWYNHTRKTALQTLRKPYIVKKTKVCWYPRVWESLYVQCSLKITDHFSPLWPFFDLFVLCSSISAV